jgi:hypothetical protein
VSIFRGFFGLGADLLLLFCTFDFTKTTLFHYFALALSVAVLGSFQVELFFSAVSLDVSFFVFVYFSLISDGADDCQN